MARAAAFAREPAPSLTAPPPDLSFAAPGEYVSEGDYWWPDPSKPSSLPFIRRDGESFPGAFSAHRLELRRFRTGLSTFAAAWLQSGDRKWVDLAGAWVGRFLLDPVAGMKPHLKFAQGIRGICKGRGIGVIDTLHLVEVPLAVEAMEGVLPPSVVEGTRRWFSNYLAWLLTDPQSLEESREKNNHGTAWTFQVAAFARFTGDEKTLGMCLDRFKNQHLPEQMAENGSFPLERKRTKPYAYSIFNLDLFAGLCQVLATVEPGIFTHAVSNGRSPEKGMGYLAPYLANKEMWDLPPDIEAWSDWPVRCASPLFFGAALHNKRWLDLYAGLPASSGNPEVRRNLYMREPRLWFTIS